MFSLLTLCSVALAQDPQFEDFAKEEELKVEKPDADLSAELGGVLTTGNARFYNLGGGVKAGRKWTDNRLSGAAGLSITRAALDLDANGVLDSAEREQPVSDWALSAQLLTTQLRYDRFLGEKTSLYALAGADSNVLAGFRLRSHEQLGVSRGLVNEADLKLFTEVGVDFAQEEYAPGSDLGKDGLDYVFPSARVMVGAEWVVNENVKVTEEVEVFENLLTIAGPAAENDLRLYNRAAMNVKLSDKMSLRLSHNLTFDNVPVLISDGGTPDDASDDERFAKLDQTTMVTFVASIF